MKADFTYSGESSNEEVDVLSFVSENLGESWSDISSKPSSRERSGVEFLQSFVVEVPFQELECESDCRTRRRNISSVNRKQVASNSRFPVEGAVRLTVEDLSIDVGLRRRSLTFRDGKVGREGGGSEEQGGKEGGAHGRGRVKRVWGELKTTKESV